MIPASDTNEVSVGGATAGTFFGISLEDSAHIMTLLRDTLYTDKVLAVLREYGSNAWDANKAAGRGDIPIQVSLPTKNSLELVIRDFGPGMTEQEVMGVYTQYGASTKRSSNESVGMFGIGAKSAFAYTSSFTITSWVDGKRSVYVASLDSTNKGVLHKLLEEASVEQSGVEIRIPVEQDDIMNFQDTAKDLFCFFSPQPKINITLPVLKDNAEVVDSGFILRKSRPNFRNMGIVVVMGCIPYKVDYSKIRDLVPDLDTFHGGVYVDIGSMEVSTSREELRYNGKAEVIIAEKLSNVVDDLVTSILSSSNELTDYEKRVKFKEFSQFCLDLPEGIKEYLDPEIKLPRNSTHFQVRGFRRRDFDSRSITVEAGMEFILVDTSKGIRTFDISSQLNDTRRYLVRRKRSVTVADMITAFNSFLVESKMEGVSVIKLSSLPTIKTVVETGKRKLEASKAGKYYLASLDEGGGEVQLLLMSDYVPRSTDIVGVARMGYDVHLFKKIVEPLLISSGKLKDGCSVRRIILYRQRAAETPFEGKVVKLSDVVRLNDAYNSRFNGFSKPVLESHGIAYGETLSPMHEAMQKVSVGTTAHAALKVITAGLLHSRRGTRVKDGAKVMARFRRAYPILDFYSLTTEQADGYFEYINFREEKMNGALNG